MSDNKEIQISDVTKMQNMVKTLSKELKRFSFDTPELKKHAFDLLQQQELDKKKNKYEADKKKYEDKVNFFSANKLQTDRFIFDCFYGFEEFANTRMDKDNDDDSDSEYSDESDDDDTIEDDNNPTNFRYVKWGNRLKIPEYNFIDYLKDKEQVLIKEWKGRIQELRTSMEKDLSDIRARMPQSESSDSKN